MTEKIYNLRSPRFLKREYAKHLDNICRFTKNITGGDSLSPGEEWLFDNSYLAVKEAKFALNELDRIKTLPFSDSRGFFVMDFSRHYLDKVLAVNVEKIGEFLYEYESTHILTLGEIEALPVFLRLELLRRLSVSLSEKNEKDGGFYRAVFTALRALSSTETEELLGLSETERILENDPAGNYGSMNTNTKNHYRKRLFSMALKSNLTERETALRLISESSEKKRHIGELLFPENKSKVKDCYIYIQLIAALVFSLGLSLLFNNYLYFFALILPVFEAVKKLEDFICLKIRKPKPLFAMELKEGIPDGGNTAIAFSALLVSDLDVDKIIKNLERLWYTNKDKNLLYGVLADFKDSDRKKEKNDAHLMEALEDGISDLEKRLSKSFYCLIRERSYNEREKKYIGHERKRGAVCTLVKYIVEGILPDGEIFGNREGLRNTKYVIALDADTLLPAGSALELCGAMLHPLNKPVINTNKGIVEKGYGIIVPKISANLSSSTKSLFAMAFAGFGGTQTYNSPDYDLYFDILDEGSFTGKGIFDVKAFYHTALKKVPDNKILSHDLVEGFFLRTGYLGSVSLTDSFPSGVLSYFNRLHRWYRGDIQSLIFLFNKVKTKEGKLKTYISFRNKYKLFDNVRRLFTPVSQLLLITLGFYNIFLFIIGLLSLFSGQLITVFDILVQNGKEALKIRYSGRTLPVLQSMALSCFFGFVLLPYQSYVGINAFFLTLYRMLISKRNLLKWTTAAEADKKYKGTVFEYFEKMAVSTVFGTVLLLFSKPVLIASGLIFILSPLICFLISREIKEDIIKMSEREKETLTSYARDMYAYYADFMNRENNFLPPDNFQEDPLYCLAKRTSPTNIGLGLLCHVAAYDLGFITKEQLFDKIELSIITLEKAEKYKGHLYNWYDTVTLKPLIPKYISTVDSGNLACSLSTLYEALNSLDCRTELLKRIKVLERDMDFSFLYNKKKQLLYIGCDSKGDTGESLYDLFMSECRMTSYYLISRGVLPRKHWFSMGRLYTGELGYFGLKSWTGTMFEYLMPNLFLPITPDSLLYEATSFAISAQKRRINNKKIPYGISESGFYAFDRNLFYQYKAFGVSSLGLKKGLDNELVISPYSSFLTLPYDLSGALSNLEMEKSLGFYGRYGFYEAADYTKSRINGEYAVVKSYMAHHVGMSLLALCNALFDNIFVKRFMADRQLESFNELLEEKLPETVTLYNDTEVAKIPEKERAPHMSRSEEISLTSEKGVVLSNGKLSCFLTDNGCGFIKYKDINATRYRSDNIKFPLGIFAFLTDNGKDYSLTYSPFCDNSLDYKASLAEHRAVYFLNTKAFGTRLLTTQHKTLPAQFFEITVSNKTNLKKKDRLTVYLEPTLAKSQDEQSHPAFSSLFTCTSYDDRGFVLFTRRRRKEQDKELWMAAGLMTKHGNIQYETMRENILPRLDGIKRIDLSPGSFKGVSPSPIDPCLSISVEADILPRGKAKLTLLICFGRTKKEAADLFEEIRKTGAVKLLSECLPLYSRLSESDQSTVSRLLPSIYYPKQIYGDPLLRISEPCELWKYGISGDLPIISAVADKKEDMPYVKSAIRIFSHIRLKGVECDLAILYYEEGDYNQPVLNSIKSVVSSLEADNLTERRGGIFLINEKKEDRALVLRYSVFVFNDEENASKLPEFFSPFTITKAKDITNRENLTNQTQTGGFINGGYKVTAKDFWSFRPPYCMVLANRSFGTLVSDSSLGYTYAVNSRENRITPWSNDVVYDNNGEKLYLRIDGEFYDICREGHTFLSPDEVIYTSVIREVEIKVRVTVHPVLFCKIINVSFKNLSAEKKEFKVCMYLEPVMGVNINGNGGLINTVREQNSICFNSAVDNGFCGFAYLHLNESGFYTNDRLMFLQGIWDGGLSLNVLPCIVRGTDISLPEKGEKGIRFILGFSKSIKGMEDAVSRPLEERCEKPYIRINTPDSNLNIFYNDFVFGQLMQSRIFSRTGFYQSGGAYGFRDQLQDSVCAGILYPSILKKQILRSCLNQFPEGDVLHWWHEFYNKRHIRRSKGVRTRCSDDLLWLPYSLCEYVRMTGDYSILDLKVRYQKDRCLYDDEQEAYLSPEITDFRESVYIHGLKALKKGCNFGENGLILMGSGDWNDGMNLVGAKGFGTSVWLSMFLIVILKSFSELCLYKNDEESYDFCKKTEEKLRHNIEKSAFDNGFYKRGFFDNGDPLGSSDSDECKIDILPQAFSSICGLDEGRVRSALDAAYKFLVNEKYKVVALFTPPFDNSKNNPGYIKSYIPGIRENGGQYTHAALWYALGLIKNNQTDRALEILKMINPVNHALSNKDAKRYRTEPYALCGDVYLAKNLEGRGGWSLYTGSAGWFFKIVTEEILGIKRTGNRFEFSPNPPSSWDGFEAEIFTGTEKIVFKAKKDENGQMNIL